VKSKGEIDGQVLHVGYQLLQSRVGMVKSMTIKHVQDDVCHARRGQLRDVERTTLFLTHFVDHLFHFSHDPRLHHSTTETELPHDGQPQLVIAPEPIVVVTEQYSYGKQGNLR